MTRLHASSERGDWGKRRHDTVFKAYSLYISWSCTLEVNKEQLNVTSYHVGMINKITATGIAIFTLFCRPKEPTQGWGRIASPQLKALTGTLQEQLKIHMRRLLARHKHDDLIGWRYTDGVRRIHDNDIYMNVSSTAEYSSCNRDCAQMTDERNALVANEKAKTRMNGYVY